MERIAGVMSREKKNPRKTTEIWWVDTYYGKETAEEVAKALAPIVGKVKPKKWTFTKSHYDVIVVVGENVAK